METLSVEVFPRDLSSNMLSGSIPSSVVMLDKLLYL
jgi:hypothetical protein